MIHPSAAARPEDRAAYWRQQAAQNEHERRLIARASLGGLPIGLALGWYKLLWGLAAGALCLLVYILGMYMTWVRRGEFRDEAEAAEAEANSLVCDAKAEQ